MISITKNGYLTGEVRRKGPKRASSSSLKDLDIETIPSSENPVTLAHFRRSDSVDGNYILTYLQQNPEIQELVCDGTIEEEHLDGIHSLLVNYHASVHLTSLELPNNGLTASSAEHIANILQVQQETLLKFNISRNPLTGEGLSKLSVPLTMEMHQSRLQILNLSDTQLGSKGATQIASILRENKSIKELNLSHNNLGRSGMKNIASDLGGNSILQVLDLSFNNIQKGGAATLAKALQKSTDSNLRVIDVTCNNLGPAGLKAFTTLLAVDRRIEGFLVGSNDVGDEGSTLLGNALKYNYTLKELRLDDNNVGDAGAWALFDGLAQNEHGSALERLSLGWNDIGLVGATDLAETLKENAKLSHISLTGNKICSIGAAKLAASLSYNLSLKELNLTRNVVGDDGAFAFALAMGKPTCNLKSLIIQDNSISEEGLASLERVPQLRRNQKYWFGQLLKDLSKNAVSSINLKDRLIADEELILLTESIVQYRPLLRTFWLSGRGVTSRSLVPFVKNAIGHPSGVIRLYIKDCTCGDAIAKALGSALPKSSLEVLSLNRCSLSAIGASALAEGLKRNKTLRRLNLDHNRIGDVGMLSLMGAIPGSSLLSLAVSQNALTDQSITHKQLAMLTELHANGNQITDLGCVEFCKAIMDDCRLVFVSLRQNHVQKRGGEAIQTFLPQDAVVDY